MADPFESNAPGLSSPATRHFAITPADEDLEIIPRAIYVDAEGTVIATMGGVAVTYNVSAGDVLPIRPTRIAAASTATVIGWY
jgi:hypothetical protein